MLHLSATGARLPARHITHCLAVPVLYAGLQGQSRSSGTDGRARWRRLGTPFRKQDRQHGRRRALANAGTGGRGGPRLLLGAGTRVLQRLPDGCIELAAALFVPQDLLFWILVSFSAHDVDCKCPGPPRGLRCLSDYIIFQNAHVSVYIYIYTCACMCTCVYTYVSRCIHTCIYVYTHIYIYIHSCRRGFLC